MGLLPWAKLPQAFPTPETLIAVVCLSRKRVSLSSLTSYYQISLGLCSYLINGLFYRLYLHPLTKFPGPKLAAATFLYEFHFNRQGTFIWQLEKLHERYGECLVIFFNAHTDFQRTNRPHYP